MAQHTFLLLAVFLLMGACAAHAHRLSGTAGNNDGAARQLLEVTKPSKPSDPRSISGADGFFKRLETFALAKKPKLHRMLLEVTKPSKPSDPRSISGADGFFKRLETFALAKKPKLHRRLLEKPNKPGNPTWTEPAAKFALIEKFAFGGKTSSSKP